MDKKSSKKFEEIIEIPEGVDAKVNKNMLIFKGEKGESARKVDDPKISVDIKENKVFLSAVKTTKREKKKIYSIRAHIKNAFKGVKEGHKYMLKICSGHFPMNVSVSGNEFVVKNFLGEKVPRIVKIKQGVAVKIEGDNVVVEGTNKELTGQCAASIEQLCKITNRDKRIFMDGIWIYNKDGKELK